MNVGFSTQNDFIFFITVLIIALIALVLTRKLLRVEFPFFFMGVLGAVVGLVAGSLLGKTLNFLPGAYGKWLPVVVEVFVAVAIFDLFMAQSYSVSKFFSNILQSGEKIGNNDIIVDTSALIDGRIEELAQTGFLCGRLLIAKFVLAELQNIADSQDSLKRVRGRKGMEILASLQRNRRIIVEIIQDKAKEKEKVDSKLIRLAKERKGKILTVDYNLSQVAQIEGVEVLNLHELAVAMKSQLIPGETIEVKVEQKGKEKNQGVGYLEDGTMVVVDGGSKFVGQSKKCQVVRIYQTTTGKMIFVEPN